jgi:hypothetical protein
LIERYPDTVDTTGYVRRIAGQIRLEPAGDGEQLAMPTFCAGETGQQSAAGESAAALVQYFNLYLLQGEGDWARRQLDRVKELSRSMDASVDWGGRSSRSFWDAATAIMELEFAWRFAHVDPNWSVIETKVAGVDSELRPAIELQKAAAKAFTEQIRSKEDALALGAAADDAVMKLEAAKKLSSFQRIFATLLVSFNPKFELTRETVEFRKEGLNYAFQRKDQLSGLEKETLLGLLTHQGRAYEDAHRVRARGTPEIVFTQELVSAAVAFSWIAREAKFRTREINLLKSRFPERRELIASRELSLASRSAVTGEAKVGLALVYDAATQLATAAELATAPAEKGRIREAWTRAMNDLGWQLILNGRFFEALQVLETVRREREATRQSDQACNDMSENDRELAAVYQNIADANIAIGGPKELEESERYATKALSCLAKTDLVERILNALKTQAICFILPREKRGEQERP